MQRRLHARRQRSLQERAMGPKLIRAFADRHPDATFVEIGANDGLQHDHLRPAILQHRWRGVMVEPVDYVFERLRANYRCVEGVSLEQAAISDTVGTRTLYHLAPAGNHERDGLPQWYDGIGSFSREFVLSHARSIHDISERLVASEVPTLTFDALCTKHGLSSVDLLLIDAEGYDGELLRHIDFARRRPALVIYEHYHLQPAERSGAAARMRDHGYETREEGFDTWCLRSDFDSELTALWRRLRVGIPGLYVQDER